jgi:para-aminobenzoate synthetase component 1
MIHGHGGVGHFSTPVNAASPGIPVDCQAHHRALCRFSWSILDGGDPAELVSAFLAGNGLPVRDFIRSARKTHPTGAGTICGAALYVSAAAGSVMAGGAFGAPDPVPDIPDVVAVVYVHTSLVAAPPADPPIAGAPPWRLGEWRASWTHEEHVAAVSGVRAAIGRGDVYQVNLVGHASAPYTGDPAAALRRVAALPGARYGGVLTSDAGAGGPGSVGPGSGGSGSGGSGSGSTGSGGPGSGGPGSGGPGSGGRWAIATASPETLVEVRDGRVITRPIKGTRPATPEGRLELLASAKERAEHVMIVDLERNDLARLPGAGPVRVDELFAVRRWCGLWQAESVVSAPLAGGVGLADLLRAVCPGGSVTGAPKLAALAEIARYEPVGRGVSMGALGWIGTDHLDLGLSIRTAAVDGSRVHVWAGGGITWGSDPDAEVDEAAAKAAPIRAALAAG